MSYDEHLISQAGGDGEPANKASTPRTEDLAYGELFPPSSLLSLKFGAYQCDECGAVISDLDIHVTWHNKLLP